MMHRRTLLRAAAATPLLGTLAAPAVRAQGKAPGFTHTVRLIVPNAPGGTSDILARLIAPELTQAFGQNVVVENRAGAGGNIGADAVAKADPDGHTMALLDLSVLAINPSLFPKIPFDVKKDLAPVSMVIYAPYILAVKTALPVNSAAELEAYAKKNPGVLNAANSGTGTATHLVQVALGEQWKAPFTHVPYRGGAPGLTALVTGEADMTVVGATQALPYVLNKQMKGIAVTGPARFGNLPDAPTFRELGWTNPDAGTWQGVITTGGTPAPMVERISATLKEALAKPAIASRIAELGGQPRPEGADSMRAWLERETENYGSLIRQHNIKPD
ncbi:Bug family tripartite tricarboxylate transporter substrate binding protein [Pseudoroseomonas globiformis]|uniref:Bug family tripartite tricarboxylate transporter substrate binding protein n=1 Tax=Teichococcus globiformis TaxID=2307229 RepID=A0ABV7G2S9_9PROT